jgi:two-component system cell cycle response regulator
MPATGSGDAFAVAERIRRALEGNPVRVGPHLVRQTVSIGVATWDGQESAEALEHRADQAMYRAKRAGRNRVALATEPLSGAAT